jgi:type II secretory pathway pseudopilin PulG
MKKAFTIIETLVAITILMIAISGPLTSAFRALTASVAARDQMTANFLAQEAIEYVRNVKDNNIDTAVAEGPLDGLSGCMPSAKCPVSTYAAGLSPVCASFQSAECRLYQKNDGTFTTTATGNTGTNFYRTFYLKEITLNSARAVVDVSWSSGAYGTATSTIESDLYFITK